MDNAVLVEVYGPPTRLVDVVMICCNGRCNVDARFSSPFLKLHSLRGIALTFNNVTPLRAMLIEVLADPVATPTAVLQFCSCSSIECR